MTDLATATNQQLLDELARRIGASPARAQAGRGKKEPSTRAEFLKLAEWAEKQAADLNTTLTAVRAKHVPSGPEVRKKADSVQHLQEGISKFTRIAKSYRKKADQCPT